MKKPQGVKRNRSARVLIRQGHLLMRIQSKLGHLANWTYSGLYMTWIRKPDEAVVLYGRNDDEENLLTSALALTLAYRGNIVYLADDKQATQELLRMLAASVAGSSPERVQVVLKTKRSIRRLHVRSQLVITSHVLMAAPRARGQRIHIHVSHGLGPKTYRNIGSSETALASNTSVWNLQHLQAMHKTPQTTTILPGYPRQDALLIGNTDRELLTRLKIDPEHPFVIWAPTVRSASFGTSGRWTEGVALQNNDERGTWELISAFQSAAKTAGVRLIAKPHPVEADAMRGMGLDVVTNDELWSVGISPYQFIGLSNGLISDYSSVWIDYFTTKKSIGLYCPDIQIFQEGIRGLLDPPFATLASGLFIESDAEVEDFFECVKNNQIYRREAYFKLRDDIGYIECDVPRTKLFIDEIRRMGALQGVSLAFKEGSA